MPLKESTIRTIRNNSLRAFKTLSRGKGVYACKFYPAVTLDGTEIVKRNLYHDVMEDTGPGFAEPIDTYTYIDMAPPLKVVKDFGWFKEDDPSGGALPTIAYLPYEETFKPEKAAKIVVDAVEGYMSGTYVITDVKAYGQGVPVLWVVNVVPERTTT